MKDQYVILTGSKNNAGDYLIKHRAKKLFEAHRPDREIVDYNAWEPFDREKLKTVNNSRALILLGGPALQFNMRPKIYKMVNDLTDITAPIIMMGVGWKSGRGNWIDTYDYPLNNESITLLNKIQESGFASSVRDYHSLNVLQFKGVDNFIMTGCPAYYDMNHIGKDVDSERPIKKVAFSLGVSFIKSQSMEKQMKENILKLKNKFEDSNFEVVFHHSINPDVFLKTHNATTGHLKAHTGFAKWLESNDIKYKDISGSAAGLIDYYSSVDMHVGYRVHAHIFMNSISKPSILLAEDGRGKATKNVIGGIVIESYKAYKDSVFDKVLSRFLPVYDRFKAVRQAPEEVVSQIDYEERTDRNRLKISRKSIDSNYEVMLKFLNQLP